MTPRQKALKQLLAGDLPLDRVGPHLRQAVRRALLSGDAARMSLVARVVVAELLRRGDLVRVAAEGGADLAGTFCLVRGTRRFLDISAIDGDPVGAPPSPTPRVSALDDVDDGLGNGTMFDLAELIGVLEDAGRLDYQEPRAGEAGGAVDAVLDLMSRYMPQVRLFALMHESGDVPENASRVFAVDPREGSGGWLSLRKTGGSAWISSPAELPGAIRACETEAQDGDEETFSFQCAAAVPLFEPPAGDDGGGTGPEAGLLFLVAGQEWPRDHVLRLARRVSGFVTRRWRSQRDVNRRIHTDGLTGVYNRRYFDNQFTHELERARRSGVALTLVLGDLDHFKAVNDTLGHQAGDRLLKAVAQRLLEELRRIDHVCRIGGEEFALILPDTSHAAAQEVMRRLLDAPFFIDTVVDGQQQRVQATFSYGVVTSPDAGSDAFELYRKADAMLYLSKDAGRNRCHFWSSSGEHLEMLPRAAGTA